MTNQAREVLSDCEAALGSLADCEYGSEWRRHWVTVLALLRAVGHVLEKVDSKSSPRMAFIVREQFNLLKRTKPEPRIFWNFIEEERNNVLKEYRISGVHASNASSVTFFAGGRNVTASADGTTHMHVFDRGAFTGRHQVEVAAEAVAWWTAYLQKVETLAHES